ncbi:MAG: type II secretion system F family protein [Gemmataceae bacterium]
MFFSSRFSIKTLVALCQSFRVGLSAGLSLVDVFRQQARKGPFESRAVIERIAQRLKEGDSLDDALKDERRHFTPLFVGMTIIAEQTGNLAEVFHELEEYYRNLLTLRRQFLTDIFWPVFQFVAAVGVISLFIIILGFLPGNQGDPPMWDPLGFGVGMLGALRFLLSVTVFLGGLWLIYVIATRGLGAKAAVHRFLLGVPAIGPCWRALCLSRLCLGMGMALDTSLSTPKALRLSLAATGNGAFEACSDDIATSVKRGDEISTAFGRFRVFPEEFVQVISTGEESGSLPEVMRHQSKLYQEEASLKMKILTRVASFAVYGFIVLLLVFAIAKMVCAVGGVYQQAFKEAGV